MSQEVGTEGYVPRFSSSFLLDLSIVFLDFFRIRFSKLYCCDYCYLSLVHRACMHACVCLFCSDDVPVCVCRSPLLAYCLYCHSFLGIGLACFSTIRAALSPPLSPKPFCPSLFHFIILSFAFFFLFLACGGKNVNEHETDWLTDLLFSFLCIPLSILWDARPGVLRGKPRLSSLALALTAYGLG